MTADTTAAAPSLIRGLQRSLPMGILATVLGVAGLVIGIGTSLPVPGLLRAIAGLAGALLLKVGVSTILASRGSKVTVSTVLAIGWVVIVVGLAVFVDLLPIKESSDPSVTLLEPVMATPNLFSAHPLGTDRHGLDILGGLAYGARVSLIVGLGATVLGGLVGIAIGLTAGYVRGWTDRITSVITDAMLAFPALILLLAVVAVLKPSVLVVTCALALLTVPSFVRLARANTMSLSHSEFVLNARALGARRSRVLIRELFPNVIWPLMSYSVIVVSAMIVAEAALSYLGLSIQRPNPTWGNMIAAGQDSFQRYPHLVLVPGIAMFLTVLALNAIGEHLLARYSTSSRNR